MPEKKEKKEPLDMTTDEAMDYLFPKEVVERLKGVANPPPTGEKQDSKASSKSTRKHDNK